jgi:transposase-like protein
MLDQPQANISLPENLISAIIKGEDNAVMSTLQFIFNEVMKIERELHLNAGSYERTIGRQGHANGFKSKTFLTSSGPLQLDIPQVRDSSFYPSAIEKGSRSEQSLKLAIAEMYIQGVSTRKVADIVKKLCGKEISSAQVSNLSAKLDVELEKFRSRKLGEIGTLYLDARYEKVRLDGVVVDVAVLIATGINSEGKREVLGVSIMISEAEVHWRSFLSSLLERGLTGVKLIVSDDHAGLKAARKSVLPSVPWQRCLFHYCQNAQAYVPKVSMREEIAQSTRDIFNCASKEEALQKLKSVVEKYKTTACAYSNWLESSAHEVMTFYDFDRTTWKKIRTINFQERLNREIKRRTRVVGVFPNIKSLLRLVTAQLVEIHEDWTVGNKYLNNVKI